MDLKQISEFIKKHDDFKSITVKDGDFFFEMEKPTAETVATVVTSPVQADAPKNEDEGLKAVESPFIGTFHELEDLKLEKGLAVSAGQAVCSIEAMKLFNEITMPEDGTIVSVEAKEGDVLEYGQVLFRYKTA